MEGLDDRVWAAVSRAVSNPVFVNERLMALQAPPSPSDDAGAELRARVKALAGEQRNLLAALRKAPTAAEAMGVELEKVASERKAWERELIAVDAAQAPRGDMSIDQDTVLAFCRAMKPYLKAMAPEKRRELLSLLGFEASVADNGTVKASIAVPSAPAESNHHCTNMGMSVQSARYC